MYLENITLQVTNTNIWRNSSKDAFRRRFVQRNNKDTHQLDSTRVERHRGVIHVQTIAHHAKAVAGGHGQGVADP
jgi:hypothetical protein